MKWIFLKFSFLILFLISQNFSKNVKNGKKGKKEKRAAEEDIGTIVT